MSNKEQETIQADLEHTEESIPQAEAERKVTELVESAGFSGEMSVILTDGSIAALTPLSDVIADLGSEAEAVVDINDLLDTPIAVIDVQECKGDFGVYVFVLFRDQTGRLLAFTTGGVVVMRKLLAVKAANRFPVSCTISKPDNYYNIV